MSTVRAIVLAKRRALTALMVGWVLTATGVASAEENVSEADSHMAGGRYAEAGSAYRRAFAETGEAEFLKKAGQAFLALGPHGKKDAVLSFRLYGKNVKGEKRRDEAKRLLKQAEALPEPTPEAPPAAAPATEQPAAAPATAADPAAPVPPPPAPEPAPAAPPPPPPQPVADELPPAEPIESIGALRWSPSLGFVQPGDAAPARAPQKDAASSGGVAVPEILDLSLGSVGWSFGVGATTLNPINDGVTDDATAVDLLELQTGVRAEFRTMTDLLSWWFDLSFSGMLGERTQTEPVDNGVVMGVQSFLLGGRLGLDLRPVPAIAIGPFGGYRMDLYQANLSREEGTDTITDNGFESDSGLQYGVHAILRTKERAGEPATFYFEPMLARRHGKLIGLYAGAEVGLRAGAVYFRGWFERRLGAEGSFTYSRDVGDPDAADGVDAPTLSHALALAMPVEQRIGGGMTVMF
jgi:hypothetical protein